MARSDLMTSAEDRTVRIYTDGSCRGNPGPGGWGVLMIWRGEERELKGGEAWTTNNRMELMAAIQGLEALKRGATVELFTDSRYVQQGITRWIHGWKANGCEPPARRRSRMRICGSALTGQWRRTG